MVKGYVKADADSLAWALFGATTTLALGQRMKNVRARWKALGGATAGLAARAALDPTLKAERAAA